jgi:hypothetical protein
MWCHGMLTALQMSGSSQKWTQLLKCRTFSLKLVHSDARIRLRLFNRLQESYRLLPISCAAILVFVCSQVYLG